MTGWLLEGIEIEGFRGINNEGAPLLIKFKTDKVNSISAPNGVGKSSIFDALTYALTGKLAKLDRLPAAETASSYYLNRFHTGNLGTIRLMLIPSNGDSARTVTVTRTATGTRQAVCSDGADAEEFLAELNREFVLLDAETFQGFIARSPLDRGRGFAGLLGLAPYSALRQALQALSHTRAFNNHFAELMHRTSREAAARRVEQFAKAVNKDYLELVKTPISEVPTRADAQKKAHHSLAQIGMLSSLCAGKAFLDIDLDACDAAIGEKEGGAERQKIAELNSAQDRWAELLDSVPDETEAEALKELARKRDDALSGTKGNAFRQLYELGRTIAQSDIWQEKNQCPLCDHKGEAELSENLKVKLSGYSLVEEVSEDLLASWGSAGWTAISILEQAVLIDGETNQFKAADARIRQHGLAKSEVESLLVRLTMVKSRATDARKALHEESEALSKKLPPSLVAVSQTVQAARRLRHSWNELERAEEDAAIELKWNTAVERVKDFLDKASAVFAKAESEAGVRRVAAVEPLCQSLFSAIMHEPVVPSLKKRPGTEELQIQLAKFFSLTGGSAPALLAESFRNALAASVFLAAAKLYGGSPKFLVLDDITSSFDAGHQYHLMEVIRTQFARPAQADGPQVILLSHDTLVEKLFNKNASTGAWWHQRLQGNARTGVLLQNNAVDKVGERTRDFLTAGRVDDAAPYIRQYLEFKLEEIIQRVRIPVPLDLAINESKQLAQGYLDAINAAVDLNKRAGLLILEAGQQASLSSHVATIAGNYLAHWGTGSSHNFSAAALIGVMNAIDAYADCFRFAESPGAAPRYYKSLSQKI